MKRLRTHVRTNVVGYVALFFSLSLGTAWAASLPDNSVGTDQIRDNGVATADIRDRTLRIVDFRRNSVGTEEIRTNGVTSFNVRDRTLRCKDLASPLPCSTVVRSHTEAIEMTCSPGSSDPQRTLTCNGAPETVRASCHRGEQATGGAYDLATPYAAENGDPNSGNYAQYSSEALSDGEDIPNPTSGTPTAWQVNATGDGFSYSQAGNPTPPADPTVTVYVVCAS